jgi:hypothetical protein
MESQQESVVIDDVSRVGGAVSGGYGETCDSFDSELHLVSVDNMLSLGKWKQFSRNLAFPAAFTIEILFCSLVTILYCEGNNVNYKCLNMKCLQNIWTCEEYFGLICRLNITKLQRFWKLDSASVIR